MLFTLIETDSVQNWLDGIGLGVLVNLMHQLEFRAFFAVVLSFVLVLVAGRPMIRWLIRQKVGDAPEFYNTKLNELMAAKAATPTMGGLVISGAIVLTTLLLADMTNRYVYLGVIVLIWLAAVGAWDDWLKLTSARRSAGAREGLYAWEKLLFQLGIGFIAGLFLYRQGLGNPAAQVLTLPFQRTYQPGTMTLEPGVILLTGFWFVVIATMLIAATSNAVNLTDGMDGLASGTLVVASLALMVLCAIAGQQDEARRLMFPFIEGSKELTILTGAMAGACLGFLWFNCVPAHVFLGDPGSLPLGGLLAYVAVAIRQEVLLVIIGGVFFLEMASVMAQVSFFKWTGGKRILRCAPVHHHFHLGGWSEQQVVTRFWILGAVFALIALVSLKLR